MLCFLSCLVLNEYSFNGDLSNCNVGLSLGGLQNKIQRWVNVGKFGSIWLFIGPNPELFSKLSHFKEILKQRNTNNKNKTIVLIAINKIYLNKNAKYDWMFGMSGMFKVQCNKKQFE